MCFQVIQGIQSLAVYMVFCIDPKEKSKFVRSEERGATQLVLLSYPLT